MTLLPPPLLPFYDVCPLVLVEKDDILLIGFKLIGFHIEKGSGVLKVIYYIFSDWTVRNKSWVYI